MKRMDCEKPMVIMALMFTVFIVSLTSAVSMASVQATYTNEFPLYEASPSMSGNIIALSDSIIKAFSGRIPVSGSTLTEPSNVVAARVNQAYARLPLYFEANEGQMDERVKFLARGRGYTLFLFPAEVVLVLQQDEEGKPEDERQEWEANRTLSIVDNSKLQIENPKSAAIRMKLVGANPGPKVIGLEELAGKSNYFIGNDAAKWRSGVLHYSKIKYEQVYPGIDLVYYGNQRQLEFDFVVAPGTNPDVIKLTFEGADGVKIDDRGDLILQVAEREVRLRKPLVYQEVDGIREEISGGYVLNPKSKISNSRPEIVGFQVAAYNTQKPLVIDPVLVYSTYLGGSGDESPFSGVECHGIAIDSLGNAYVTGTTFSTDFPTVVPFQAGLGGTTCGFSASPCSDVFVAKLSPDGSQLIYSTYLGGNHWDEGLAIAVDTFGNGYITGLTYSSDFPTTPSAFDTTCGTDGNCNSSSCAFIYDAFVVKLDPTGSALVYSTYLGGSSGEFGRSITVDAGGNAHVTGVTASTDFPVMNPIQGTFGGFVDAFVTKLNPTGSALIYSTYLGGTESDQGLAIAVDSSGSAYLTGFTGSPNFPIANALQPVYGGGFDAWAAKLGPSGSTLVYSTYLGGTEWDSGSGIAVDLSGNAYLTGSTSSPDFPIANALQPVFGGHSDAWVAKLDPSGSTPIYSTYLGGSDVDSGKGIAVDSLGNAYVTGHTDSADFPKTSGALEATHGCFVVKLEPACSTLFYSTLIDAGCEAIAVDADGNAFVMGLARAGFPTTEGAFQPSNSGGVDAFVSKIAPSVQFSAETYSVPETSGSATITVLSEGIRGEAKVDFSTSDGTAIAGSDYNSVSGALTFADGETSKTFTVPILNNPLFEGKETVILTLSNPTGNGVLGNLSSATLKINEPGILEFSSLTFNVIESGGTATITVTRLESSGGEVTVRFSATDGTATGGSDFSPTTGILTFGEEETIKTFTVPILDDLGVEGDEIVNLTLSDPTGGATFGDPNTAVLRIGDNDFLSADFFPATPADTWTYQRVEDATTVKITVLPETILVNEVEVSVFKNSEDRSQEFFSIDADGIKLHRLFVPKVWIEGLGTINLTVTFDPPVQLANAVTEIGQTAESSGFIRTNRLPRGVGELVLPYSASFTFEAIDNITVPGGNFDVMRLQGTIDIAGQAPVLFTFDLAKEIGIVRSTTSLFGETATLELVDAKVGVYDLAVTKITAPKTVILTYRNQVQTKQVKVEIQNRSPHSETIQDPKMLANLVTLTVESLGAGCSDLVPVLRPPTKPFPLTLKPKKKLTVVFDVIFDCANDGAKSTPMNPGHEDFRYVAEVNHGALDGKADTHPADDVCPRDIEPPGVDPNPDGTVKDLGCGNRRPDNTYGADVLTDAVLK
jgi:hypothetical protein